MTSSITLSFLTDLTNYHNHNQQFRSNRPEELFKQGALKNFANFTRKHLRQSLFLNKVAGLSPASCNLFKKDSSTGAFCEFCKISKNTFSYRTPPVAASDSFSICQCIDTIFYFGYFFFFHNPLISDDFTLFLFKNLTT